MGKESRYYNIFLAGRPCGGLSLINGRAESGVFDWMERKRSSICTEGCAQRGTMLIPRTVREAGVQYGSGCWQVSAGSRLVNKQSAGRG